MRTDTHAFGGVETAFTSVSDTTYRRDMTIEFDDNGIRAMYEEVASKIKDVDGEIRARFAGQDAHKIMPEVESKFTRFGIHLPDEQLRAYCDSVQNNADFEFVLN